MYKSIIISTVQEIFFLKANLKLLRDNNLDFLHCVPIKISIKPYFQIMVFHQQCLHPLDLWLPNFAAPFSQPLDLSLYDFDLLY